MRLPPRILNHPLPRRRNWIRYGNLVDLQDQRGVPWQNHGNLLSRPIPQGVWHSRWALQRHLVSPLIGWKCRWMHDRRQRSLVWYLLQNLEVDHPHLWWLEPLGLSCDVRSYLLLKIPRTIELWLEKARSQLDSFPQTPLLHGWIRPLDLKRIPTIQSLDRPWVDLINVRRQEHDVRCRPQTRKILDRLSLVQRKNVDQGSRWTNVECLKQEQFLLRWMDPQQHQELHLRYSPQGIEDGRYLRRKLHRNLRNVQESCRIIHCNVQKKGFLTLVHRRRNGRNGIHWSRIQHERLGLWISTILRCHRWRRKRIWRRRGSLMIIIIHSMVYIISFIIIY